MAEQDLNTSAGASRLEDGGPAFPREPKGILHPNGDFTHIPAADGMSLRDYFAIRMLAAMVTRGTWEEDKERASMDAYGWSDAMLKARKAGAA